MIFDAVGWLVLSRFPEAKSYSEVANKPMPHATHSSNCIYLHWVRASAHAPLAYPFSTRTIASRLTDAVEQLLGNPLADGVRSFLESVADSLPAGACELHLPFISRKEIASASGILLAAYLHCDAPGIFRLVRKDQEFEDEFFRQCVTLMAASQFESAAMIPATICFTHKAQAAAGAYLPWFPQLADAADATKDRRRVVPANFTVSLTERGQLAWRNTSPERNRNFLPVYSRLSVAMRRAMRFWIPFVFFTERDRYTDANLAWPMFAWAASFAPQAKNIRDFSYDILDNESMKKAGKSYRRGLPTYLKRIAPALATMGMSRLIARYAPDNACEGARLAEYNRSHLNTLFAGESDLVDLAQRVALDLAKLRITPALSPVRQLAQFQSTVRAFSHDFPIRLRKLYASLNWEHLATLLLIEMTNSLSEEPEILAAKCSTQEILSSEESEDPKWRAMLAA